MLRFLLRLSIHLRLIAVFAPLLFDALNVVRPDGGVELILKLLVQLIDANQADAPRETLKPPRRQLELHERRQIDNTKIVNRLGDGIRLGKRDRPWLAIPRKCPGDQDVERHARWTIHKSARSA